MRLMLDVLVYVGIIAVFVTKVVVLYNPGIMTFWEVLWIVYLLGTVWQQVMRRVCGSRQFMFC